MGEEIVGQFVRKKLFLISANPLKNDIKEIVLTGVTLHLGVKTLIKKNHLDN